MAPAHDGKAGTVILKSVQGRCGGLFERSVVFPDGAERFADTRTKPARDHGESVEHIFLSGRLHLLLIQGLAVAAIDGFQAQNVLGSEARDGAFEGGGASGAHADLVGYLRRQARVGGLVHESQGLLNALVGDQAQERRLLQLHSKALAQCSIENRIAGGVGEIGEHDGVFFRKRRFAIDEQLPGGGDHQEEENGSSGDPCPRPGLFHL